MKQTVAILGASQNPSRYAYLAFQKLRQHGHHVIPVNPGFAALEGVPVVPSLKDIREPIDTLTMYVGPKRSSELQDEIVKLKPKRVIFNPGSENPALAAVLRQAGVSVEEACTLVLLSTDQFEI
jgi:predicted CoA-binding protein